MRRLTILMMLVPAAAAAGTLNYPVVDTGQDHCYSDRGAIDCPRPGEPFAGQDAQYSGNPPHYRDNGDGTVTDAVTGLMWEKGFHRLAWGDAPAAAAAARTGGYSDWRMPTIKELYSLMDYRGSTGSARPERGVPPADARPYLDTSAFDFEYPSGLRFIDAQYLTSTAYRGITMGHDRSFFGVNFADGRIKAYPQDGGRGRRLWYARWVRGNPAYGRNDFAAAPDDTVTDRATGLTWTRGDSGDAVFRDRMAGTAMGDGRLDWGEALSFCQSLDFAGRSDWRLPNAKELQSLVDYRRSPSATDSAALDPIFRITAITEADGSRNWPYAWTSTTHLDGPRQGAFAVYIAFGKAMGNLRPGGPGMGGGPPMGGPRMDAPPGGGPPPRGPFGPPTMGGEGDYVLTDVHGAGAQRSSPKSGDESRLPIAAGPQGDVLRIYNYARCVASGAASR